MNAEISYKVFQVTAVSPNPLPNGKYAATITDDSGKLYVAECSLENRPNLGDLKVFYQLGELDFEFLGLENISPIPE